VDIIAGASLAPPKVNLPLSVVKPAVAPGQFAARKRYRRNVSLNSRNLSFEFASLRWRVRIPEAETGGRSQRRETEASALGKTANLSSPFMVKPDPNDLLRIVVV